MIYEEILFMLCVTIFALILHYYIGVIDIWYIPAFEILVALVIYQISLEMHKSYSTYKEHKETQEKARNIEKIQEPSKIEEKKIKFEKTKEVIKFPVDETIMNKVEVSYGKEEIMSDDESEIKNDESEITKHESESV